MNKRFAMIGTLSFAAALMAAPFSGTVYAENDGATVAPADVLPFGAHNGGAVLCTAAINSDGSVAGGRSVNKTKTSHPALGVYNVYFDAPCAGNIRVNNGWARWTQVDTLQFGTTSGSCHTADLAATVGVGAVWVNCEDEAGARADRSFTLFVAR